jgi:hypothetical protein
MRQALAGSPSASQSAAASSPEPGVESDEAIALAAALQAVEALETSTDERPAEADRSALDIAAATSTDIETLDAGFDLGFADPEANIELMLDVEAETDNAIAVDTADNGIDIASGDLAAATAVPAVAAAADPAFDSSLDAEADALFVAAVAASMGADEDDAADGDRNPALDEDDRAEGPAEIPTLTDSVEVAAADEGESADEIFAAFATAKALEDISNSMAETLFGDAELDQLAATFAARIAQEEAFAERELAADESAEDSEAGAVVKTA